MPLDINQNNSWEGSSSDSDINDMTNVKSLEQASDLFIHNNSSTYVSHKLTPKYKQRKQKKCEQTTIYTGILPKRTRVTSLKNKTQPGKAQVHIIVYINKQLNSFLILCINEQGQKRQANKIQKKKIMLKDKFKSSRMCNGQVSCVNSNAMNDSKDVSYKNSILYNNTYEHQNILKIDKRISSQNKSIRMTDSIVDFKRMSNYQEMIKPCFVKLNAYVVQNYMLSREKIAKNKQDMLRNTKFLYTNTLQTDKNFSKIQNTILQSTSSEYDDFGNFKHMSVKQCSVALCDDIVKDCCMLKRNIRDTNIKDESNIPHLVSHNSSEIALNCYKNINLAPHDTKKVTDLIKSSFVKLERLKIGEFVKKNDTVYNKKEQDIVSSTPIGKRAKLSTSLVIFSPINSNIYDKLYWSQEYSSVTVKDNTSNIDHKDSCSLITMSGYKLDPADIQEQQTQVLLSQKSQVSTDSIIENGITFYKNNVHVVSQKYETECNVGTEIPHSLNMSTISTNQSRSLFDDTTYNHSAKDTNKDNMEEKYFSDALTCKFVKMNTVDSSVDLCLEQKQLLSNNEQANASSQYISPSKVCITFTDLDNVTQKYDNKFQENDARINAVETIHENFKDETVNSKYSVLGKCQNNINVDASVLLTRLQDPIRIGRRMQYPKWHLSMSNISNSLNNEATQSNNEISHCVVTEKDFSHIQSAYNSEQSKNTINSSLDHSDSFNGTTQYSSTNKQIEKSVFLKPGKCWARSLSILSNINDKSNLDKLSIGKGKKWRRSVRDILDMQKRGNYMLAIIITR